MRFMSAFMVTPSSVPPAVVKDTPEAPPLPGCTIAPSSVPPVKLSAASTKTVLRTVRVPPAKVTGVLDSRL